MAKGMDKGNKGNDRLQEKKGAGKKGKKQDIAEVLSTIPEWYTPEEWAEIHDREGEAEKSHTSKNAKKIEDETHEATQRTAIAQIEFSNKKDALLWRAHESELHRDKQWNLRIQQIDEILKYITMQYPGRSFDFTLLLQYKDILIHHKDLSVVFVSEYDKIFLALIYDLEFLYGINLDGFVQNIAKLSLDNKYFLTEEMLIDAKKEKKLLLKKITSWELIQESVD